MSDDQRVRVPEEGLKNCADKCCTFVMVNVSHPILMKIVRVLINTPTIRSRGSGMYLEKAVRSADGFVMRSSRWNQGDEI
jgi:hypothetical protein